MKQDREPGTLTPEEQTVVRRHGVDRAQHPTVPRALPVRDAETPPADRPEKEGSSGSDRSQTDSGGYTGSSSTGAGMTPVSDSIFAASTAVLASRAVAADEATRARGFSAAMGTACLLAFGSLPLLGGDPRARAWCLAALALMATVSFWVWWLTRSTSRYPRRVNRLYGWTLATGVISLEYYLGFFSPAVVVVTLGIYFFAQSTDRVYSVLIPVYASASYALLASLTAFGVIEDRGLFSAEQADLSARIFAVVAISMVFALTLRMSHIARASMVQAIKKSNQALLQARKDEALLAEVRHQLDRAMRIAVGKPGRYTGEKAGDYRLGVVIGVGAMGEVYAAEHPVSGEPAAVKLLHAGLLADETLFERFRRESAISLELRHPNLVRVFDMGRLADGSPYMTMERLQGEDLAARLRRQQQLEPGDVVELVREIAAGLGHAHERGVVHRDLKPHNLFRTVDGRDPDQGRWKVLDFGISKLRDSSSTLTREGIVGTPGFMSPEQARGLAVDHRSDLFSLASVVYRTLTGRPPFPGPNAPQIMFDVVYRNPDRPSHAAPGLTRDLELVLAIGLAKDPDRRFSSAEQFAAALQAAAGKQLDPELRERARRLIKRYPWSAVVGHGA